MWANSGSQGGLFNFTQDASLDYNLIDCCIFISKTSAETKLIN